MAFKVVRGECCDELESLDDGAGGCPLLGDHPVELLADRLARSKRSHPLEVSISGVARYSKLERKLFSTFAGGYGITRHAFQDTRIASLDGGLRGYMARRSAHLRKNLRREARKANAAGIRFERVRPRTLGGARTNLRRMLAVEGCSWKADGPSCSIANERTLNTALLDRLSQCQGARIIYAKHGTEDVGFIFGGVSLGTYAGLHFGYREAWARHSIGNLLQLETIGWLCEEGLEQYDMGIAGAGRLGYKERWAERCTPMHVITLSRE